MKRGARRMSGRIPYCCGGLPIGRDTILLVLLMRDSLGSCDMVICACGLGVTVESISSWI